MTSGGLTMTEGWNLQLQGRVRKLEEALRPFAAIAGDRHLANHPDSYAPRPAGGHPNMGDYRRAAAALVTISEADIAEALGEPLASATDSPSESS